MRRVFPEPAPNASGVPAASVPRGELAVPALTMWVTVLMAVIEKVEGAAYVGRDARVAAVVGQPEPVPV
jgi:hypothetical protein